MLKIRRYGLHFLIVTTILLGDYVDTGFKTWKQPDGTEFIARLWGDEFASKMETEAGYVIKKDNDNYYYYAILDTNGGFTPSNNKVTIDTPLSESLNLTRSPEKLAEIDQRIFTFNQQVLQNREDYFDIRVNRDRTISIGVLLVDFTPSERHIPDEHPAGYERHFYEDMMFSETEWIGVAEPPNYTTPHPQDHTLFGSFINYFDQQSLGHLTINGTLINGINPTNPDLPEWVVLENPKSYYNEHSDAVLISDVISEATLLGYGINQTQYEKLGIIFAGKGIFTFGSTFWPHASAINGWFYVVPEITENIDQDGNDISYFHHIGVHCHEFGHLH